jgi:hypothetical protein
MITWAAWRQLGARLKFKTLITHGPNVETNSTAVAMAEVYRAAMAAVGPKELVVKPGDVIPIQRGRCESGGVRASVDRRAAARRRSVESGMRRRGAERADGSENSMSVGMLMTFGKFRFADLGDLTQDKEFEMACR